MNDRLSAALSDHYRIERELGEGGMATVYLAEDVKHDRKVALKVLKPELAAVVGGERFTAEIRTTANLQHPNILPLFDSGEADGFLYYVMPYIEGESLEERLAREGQLPIEESVRLIAELADALDHAHKQGVVHRDIKPANVMLRDGRPVLADFGIALAVGTAGGSRLTETGLSIGTPFYMSPEQAVGDQSVTAASDLYSLGCVLYEMLVGEPPHTGGSAQAVLARIITGAFERPRVQRTTIPANVDGAIAKALERVPADRFPTAGEFGAALKDESFRYGEDTDVAPVGPSRRAVVAAAVVAGVLGVFGGLVLGGVLGGGTGGGGDPGIAVRPVQMTFGGDAMSPAIAPNGDLVAFVREACALPGSRECTYSLWVQEVGRSNAFAIVEDALLIDDVRWSHDGADVYFYADLGDERYGYYRAPRLGGATENVEDGLFMDPHPRGDTLLIIDYSGDSDDLFAWVIDANGGDVIDSLPMTGQPEDIHWSQDGTKFAYHTSDQLVVINRDGVHLDSVRTAGRETIRWGPRDDFIYYFVPGIAREDDLVRISVDRAGRIAGPPQVVRAGVPTLYAGRFDLARSTGDVILETGDARTDQWVFEIAGTQAEGRQITSGSTWYGAPSPLDSRHVYYLKGDSEGDNLYLFDLETGEETALTSMTNPGASKVVFSPDGERLTYGMTVGTEWGIGELEIAPGRSLVIMPDPNIGYPSWIAPLGVDQFVVAGSGALYVLDAEGQVLREIAPLAGPMYAAAISPTESHIAYFDESDEGWALIRAPLTGDGPPETLIELPAVPALHWTSRGITRGAWLPEDRWPSVWQVGESGAGTRIVDLMAECEPSAITLSPDGELAACPLNDFRSDVWVFPGLGAGN